MAQPRSYLAWTVAAALASFAAVWVYVFAFPMGFLYTGYAVWLAKDRMLTACDTGALAVFGDSLPQAGFIPLRLPVAAANFGINAGSPIETYYLVKRMVACPRLPDRVVLSLTAVSFSEVSKYFWSTSLRTGILGWSDLREIVAAAGRLDDRSLDDAFSDDGLHGTARNILNLVRFPPLFFSSLWQGQLFLRHADNVAMLQKALAARGFVPFGDRGFGLGAPSSTGRPAAPINDYYFDRTLALLRDRGVTVDFVIMPTSDRHFREVPARDFAQFAAYLHRYEERYGNFRLIDGASHWPDEFFADGSHLNLKGAERFSDRFAHCLAEAQPDPQHDTLRCDLDWALAARDE